MTERVVGLGVVELVVEQQLVVVGGGVLLCHQKSSLVVNCFVLIL